MPIYEYQCNKCNHTFELFKKISSMYEPLDEACPSCNETGGIEKCLSSPATSFSADRKYTEGKWKDKLTQIHEKTPGSRLDQCSTITKI